MTVKHDVIVIGGGPSGSTTANLLAQAGIRVLLLERENFPRFHIGESLLPCDLEIFRRLGVDPKTEGFLYKSGAEFLDERIHGHTEYPFSDALPGTGDHAYQVDRAKFDLWLLRRAEEVGVEVHQGERALEITRDADGVSVQSDKGTYRARYLVDATGQDALLGRRAKTTKQIEDFGLAATFRHWSEIDPAIDRELCEEMRGNIKIIYVDSGWCWAIPMGNRRVSIGLVSRKRGIKSEWLDETIAASPFLSRVTKVGTRWAKPGMIASFSFHNEHQHGSRFSCVGDAACFLDPVFSSGVSLGMMGSADMADRLVPALREGREADPALMDAHAEHVGHAYNVFATLIHSFYHTNLLHGLFFAPEQDPVLRKGLTSVLAGDLWRDDNLFQQKLMSSKRRAVHLQAHLHGVAQVVS